MTNSVTVRRCFHLLCGISCLCLLHTGLCAEECIQILLAERETFHVPEGGSLFLSCVVQHCGSSAWTGTWTQGNTTEEKIDARHRLTQVPLSANQTRLTLNLLRVSQADEGYYGCSVEWGQGDTEQGHLKYVNIIAAVASQRKVLHRVLVCAGAFLCLPVILCLARCLSSEVKPHPLPRSPPTEFALYRDQPHPAPQPPPRCPVSQKRSTSSNKAPERQRKTEVVYADISQDALRQKGASRNPDQTTVYSSLKFS